MATGQRREREKEEIQRRILDAARELFASEGYEAVTMRKIADRVDYTPTALYFHFKDKRALFHRLGAVDFAALTARFQVLSRVPDPLERLRMLGRGYIAFALEHPHAYRLMFMTPGAESKSEESAERPGAAEAVAPPAARERPDRDAYRFLLRTVSEAGAAGLLRPGFEDPRLAAQTFWAGLHGAAALSIARERDEWAEWPPVDKRIDALVESLVRGLTCRC